MVTKVEGEMGDLKGLFRIMTRERTAFHRRRDYISREGGENRVKIAGLGFFLE